MTVSSVLAQDATYFYVLGKKRIQIMLHTLIVRGTERIEHLTRKEMKEKLLAMGVTHAYAIEERKEFTLVITKRGTLKMTDVTKVILE
jgi:hypothetical protein